MLKKTSKVKKKKYILQWVVTVKKDIWSTIFSFLSLFLNVQVNFNFDLWSIVFDLHNKSNHSGPLSFLKGKIFLNVILALVSSVGCLGIRRQGPGIFIYIYLHIVVRTVGRNFFQVCISWVGWTVVHDIIGVPQVNIASYFL